MYLCLNYLRVRYEDMALNDCDVVEPGGARGILTESGRGAVVSKSVVRGSLGGWLLVSFLMDVRE